MGFESTSQLLLQTLPQFEGAEGQQGEYSCKDPESYYDLSFGPAQFFKVVMDWSAEKDSFAGEFETCHLDHYRNDFHNKNSADQEKQYFLPHQY